MHLHLISYDKRHMVHIAHLSKINIIKSAYGHEHRIWGKKHPSDIFGKGVSHIFLFFLFYPIWLITKLGFAKTVQNVSFFPIH